MTRRRDVPSGLALAALLAVIPGRVLVAQDSQFGIRGLGVPGRWESVRARTTGGAFAAFDAESPLVDAALVDAGRITASTLGATSFRTVDLGGAHSALKTTRFPMTSLAGPIGHGIYLGGGFASYLDRTYELVTYDTVDVRGTPQPVTDRITSDGGVSDLRFAAAARVGSRFRAGLGLHILSGSTRVRAARDFADTTYLDALEVGELSYDGLGVSASGLILLTPALRVTLFGRSDTRLRARVANGGGGASQNDLPNLMGGAVGWQPAERASFAASVIYRNWSVVGPGSFNTTTWSAGAELGGKMPLRIGARGGQLPFGPGTKAPSEWGVAVGTGFLFSQGRGLIDLGLERLTRSGDGLRERVWTVLMGITVRP
jgi:hypothetical protein